MGSRSRPHRVLSVCVCVCVSRCLWVCVIEANLLQLRVITIGLYQFLSRSPSCQILAVCGRRLRGVSGSWFPRFLSPAAFLDSDRRRLVCPLLPCATRLSPYGKLRFCLRKAPLLPTESSASAYGKLRLCPTEAPPPPYGKLRLVSRCVLLLVINSLFPQLNPPVFIVTHTLHNPFTHPSCTSLLFILLFIKPQYTVFCTSYCFALFIPLHILLLFLFFYHIYALVLCYFYIILIFILLHCPLSGPDFTTFHF